MQESIELYLIKAYLEETSMHEVWECVRLQEFYDLVWI